ncbi:MAG TPA: bifunctional diguanylate cyclase/phosphodiesterase [Rhizomicrobium sp.]|nr:bifunctional diguanylate cyclase/phosphodiesterase [Rhizomicrobium sp.]
MVLGPSRQNKTADNVASLRAFDETERVRLALVSAGVLAFSWTLADDRIDWDGPVEILPDQYGADSIDRGKTLLASIGAESRAKLATVIATRSRATTQFQIEVEIASAMGSVWFSMLGARIPDANGAAERLTGLMREMTERRREQQRLTYLATRDELTGQLNRNSLRAELAEAIDRAKAEERNCAFLVASIDRLAMINDAYGFDAADEVIVAVGERLARILRSTDVIGRTAGNKFGVILGNCSEREIALVADRLRAAVRDRIVDTRAGMVAATCSVGAVLLPQGASSSQEAMLRAEETLTRARSAGRDGFAVYARSAQLETGRLRLMGIADDVVAALKDERLVFAYQPIVEARSRRVAHYECLLRMRREDGRIAAAGEFIPAAEQLGLVRLVDRRALEMTVAALHAHPDVVLGVNVSGTTAGDPSWLKSFIDYVRANAAVAKRMIVELTETAALHHFEENAQFVSQLRELGCRVAIDDFGAGYTSFRNLQMLRVDMVKIDGAYVQGLAASPDNQIFVRTLVDLAKNFDLKTVAEWVTSEEEAKVLESFGVDYFQGYHFGKPELDLGPPGA